MVLFSTVTLLCNSTPELLVHQHLSIPSHPQCSLTLETTIFAFNSVIVEVLGIDPYVSWLPWQAF
jgi:hypothetical protein